MLVLKNLLRLLATSTSLIALLLLFANPALAIYGNSFLDSTVNKSELQLVNLNVISPVLELTNQSHNTLLQHSGCNCAVCMQAIKQ